MKSLINKSARQIALFLLAILSPFMSFADGSAPVQGEEGSLIAEIAIGVVFVGAVTVFLIWKAKHDKKLREKQVEQMKKIAASKRRAA